MAMLRTSDRGADKSTPDTKASRAAHLLESCSSSKKTDDGESTSKSSVVTIAATMSKLKKQIQADRVAYVKARLEANNANIRAYVANAEKLSKANVSSMSMEDRNPDSVDLLTENIRKSACKPSGLEPSLLEKENLLSQDEASIVLMPGASLMGSKNMARPVKIPVVSKLPPYTTWIFLDRNQRMTEDQSVVGRRRIYYDPNGNEALICSDSEEENMDDEEEKHEFSKCDDYVIWNAVQEHGSNETLLEALGNCIDAKPSEIEARYEVLLKEDAKRNFNCSSDILAFEGKPLLGVLNRSLSQQPHKEHSPSDGEISKMTSDEDKCEDKDLDAAMDSFDNLFCRRCLVFDCRLHGCSQSVVLPSEKQTPWSNSEGSSTPCGPDCYLLASGNDKRNESKLNGLEVVPLKNKTMNGESSKTKIINVERSSVYVRTGSATCDANRRRSSGTVLDNSTDVCESTNEEPTKGKDDAPKTNTTTRGKKPGRKAGPAKKTSKRRAEEVLINIRKRTCITTEMENLASGGSPSPKKASATIPSDAMEQNAEPSGKLPKRGNGLRGGWKKVGRPALSASKSKKSDIITQNSKQKEEPMASESSKLEEELKPNLRQVTKGFMNGSHQLKLSDSKCESIVDDGFNAKKGWSELEKGLYDKGIAMFGKNSCLISRNLLKGMKTCVEVAERIMEHEAAALRRSGDGHLSGADACGKHDSSAATDADVRPRTRFWRRRGKMRRLKYTWKSAGHSTVRKRMGDGKDQPCKQYTPCGCQSNCGKQCPCMRNGTCCEKYCGCAKSCKNRFRGCHCAKSQCRSRHCPCFAAGRECDPDVCRNCWVGCGDGSLGGPPQRGDNYECRNMKLLLKQQQRVLLGRSDVAGWGAFLKNPVSKHDYLGEYTGELISHKEADKRGKIYDRENSSFLFNLNDQFVLDAYRKGDKLKFANHSPNPNCYAKVIMVAGDHRVGIFAKERILAGEELFYDYRYEADRAPVWARKPEAATTTKGSENSGSGGRAQKVA